MLIFQNIHIDDFYTISLRCGFSIKDLDSFIIFKNLTIGEQRQSILTTWISRTTYAKSSCCAQHSFLDPFWRPLEGPSFPPLQLADKSPMITDQHTAGGSVSQLSQLAKLSPWLTLSTKDITTSFWHYKKLIFFLSDQIMGFNHFSNPTE